MSFTPAELTPALTLRSMRVRAVDVRMTRPLQTAVGEMRTAPLALVDLQSAEGVTGSSYVFCYTRAGLAAVTAMLRALAPALQGVALDPVPLRDALRRRFTLLGTTGVVGLALGAIDMAVWDAVARAAAVPLARLLGGAAGGRIPAYASLRSRRPRNFLTATCPSRSSSAPATWPRISSSWPPCDRSSAGERRSWATTTRASRSATP